MMLPRLRRKERLRLESRRACLERVERFLSLAKAENVSVADKRRQAFEALEEVERFGDSEVTKENLLPLRRVLVFIERECEYDYWCDLHDILQPVQRKLEPGYDMAPDMFSALFTEAAKYQLRNNSDRGFARDLALNALRVELNVDRKRQLAGANNKEGVQKALLLLADVYQQLNEPKRAGEVRRFAEKYQ